MKRYPTTLYVMCLHGCISYVSRGRENGLNTGVCTCQKNKILIGGVFQGGKAKPTDLNLLDLTVSPETQNRGWPKKCSMRHVFSSRTTATSTCKIARLAQKHKYPCHPAVCMHQNILRVLCMYGPTTSCVKSKTILVVQLCPLPIVPK